MDADTSEPESGGSSAAECEGIGEPAAEPEEIGEPDAVVLPGPGSVPAAAASPQLASVPAGDDDAGSGLTEPVPPVDTPTASPRHRADRVPRQRRRVTTAAVPGTDPAPLNEPPRHAENENDERLKADKPPHWG